MLMKNRDDPRRDGSHLKPLNQGARFFAHMRIDVKEAEEALNVFYAASVNPSFHTVARVR